MSARILRSEGLIGRLLVLLCLLGAAEAVRASEPGQSDSATTSSGESTQLDPIEVRPQCLFPGDAEMAKLREQLGCGDCIAVDHGELPFVTDRAVAFVRWVARGLLPQPRARGEPNDEALYGAQQHCWVDDGNCQP